jgi:hypothetical protein
MASPAQTTPVPVVAADETPEVRGLTHVAAVSFLASRLAPGGQFWLALAGGVALARGAAGHGLRVGYGASIASMFETVALIGPARIQGPLTQALTAPLVGRLYARDAPRWAQIAATLVIRLAHYTVINVLYVWLVVGGLDTYVHTYDKLVGRLGLPTGTGWAVGLTVALGVAAGCFYSVVQVLVYARALRRWPEPEPDPEAVAASEPAPHDAGRLERRPVPRVALAVVLVAVIETVALVTFLTWPVLAGVTLALLAGWIGGRVHDRDALRLGSALGLALAVGALFPVLLGVVSLNLGLQRAVRAALIVLVATWARAAVGTEGVRAVASAALWRVRWLPSAREGSRLVTALASDERLGEAARELGEALRDVPQKPLPIADAVTGWVVAEAERAVA